MGRQWGLPSPPPTRWFYRDPRLLSPAQAWDELGSVYVGRLGLEVLGLAPVLSLQPLTKGWFVPWSQGRWWGDMVQPKQSNTHPWLFLLSVYSLPGSILIPWPGSCHLILRSA